MHGPNMEGTSSMLKQGPSICCKVEHSPKVTKSEPIQRRLQVKEMKVHALSLSVKNVLVHVCTSKFWQYKL